MWLNKHKSNKIKGNSNTVRHLNNGTDHRHSKSCCDQSSPARRTMTSLQHQLAGTEYEYSRILKIYHAIITLIVINTWRLRQDGRHFADGWHFQMHFSFKYIPWALIDHKPSLVQIMGCRRTGNKPLCELIMSWHSLLTHIWVTWPH